MENPYLEPYQKEADIIVLDENKLLKKDDYEKLSNEVSKIVQSAKNGYNK